MPSIATVNPNSGPLVGGTFLTIIGSLLGANDVLNVSLAGTAAASYTYISASKVVAISAATATPVTGNVTVISYSYGTASGSAFTYNQGICFVALCVA